MKNMFRKKKYNFETTTDRDADYTTGVSSNNSYSSSSSCETLSHKKEQRRLQAMNSYSKSSSILAEQMPSQQQQFTHTQTSPLISPIFAQSLSRPEKRAAPTVPTDRAQIKSSPKPTTQSDLQKKPEDLPQSHLEMSKAPGNLVDASTNVKINREVVAADSQKTFTKVSGDAKNNLAGVSADVRNSLEEVSADFKNTFTDQQNKKSSNAAHHLSAPATSTQQQASSSSPPSSLRNSQAHAPLLTETQQSIQNVQFHEQPQLKPDVRLSASQPPQQLQQPIEEIKSLRQLRKSAATSATLTKNNLSKKPNYFSNDLIAATLNCNPSTISIASTHTTDSSAKDTDISDTVTQLPAQVEVTDPLTGHDIGKTDSASSLSNDVSIVSPSLSFSEISSPINLDVQCVINELETATSTTSIVSVADSGFLNDENLTSLTTLGSEAQPDKGQIYHNEPTKFYVNFSSNGQREFLADQRLVDDLQPGRSDIGSPVSHVSKIVIKNDQVLITSASNAERAFLKDSREELETIIGEGRDSGSLNTPFDEVDISLMTTSNDQEKELLHSLGNDHDIHTDVDNNQLAFSSGQEINEEDTDMNTNTATGYSAMNDRSTTNLSNNGKKREMSENNEPTEHHQTSSQHTFEINPTNEKIDPEPIFRIESTKQHRQNPEPTFRIESTKQNIPKPELKPTFRIEQTKQSQPKEIGKFILNAGSLSITRGVKSSRSDKVDNTDTHNKRQLSKNDDFNIASDTAENQRSSGSFQGCSERMNITSYNNEVDGGGVVKKEEDDEEEMEHEYFRRKTQERIVAGRYGSFRGVKNLVKSGISSFDNIQEGQARKDLIEQSRGRILFFTTSMSVIRLTRDRCLEIKKMLQNHRIFFEERDVYISEENAAELIKRFKLKRLDADVDGGNSDQANENGSGSFSGSSSGDYTKAEYEQMLTKLPRVFVEDFDLGGYEEVSKLNETKVLKKIFKDFPKVQGDISCPGCGGYRYTPCYSCHGSKKSRRNNFTEEFQALRCTKCDENGLARCRFCNVERTPGERKGDDDDLFGEEPTAVEATGRLDDSFSTCSSGS